MSEEYPDFTVEEMLALWAEGEWDECRKRGQILWCDMHGWEYAEEGGWTQDHKYQYCDHVIRHIESGRCFQVSASRSGSYHTDWYYTYDNDPIEVKEVEKIITTKTWVRV